MELLNFLSQVPIPVLILVIAVLVVVTAGMLSMDENKRIVICRRCKKPEYWGEMRWLSGFCVCRDCYKAQWESENHKPYTWDDLDGKRPTMEEFEKENE